MRGTTKYFGIGIFVAAAVLVIACTSPRVESEKDWSVEIKGSFSHKDAITILQRLKLFPPSSKDSFKYEYKLNLAINWIEFYRRDKNDPERELYQKIGSDGKLRYKGDLPRGGSIRSEMMSLDIYMSNRNGKVGLVFRPTLPKIRTVVLHDIASQD